MEYTTDIVVGNADIFWANCLNLKITMGLCSFCMNKGIPSIPNSLGTDFFERMIEPEALSHLGVVGYD